MRFIAASTALLLFLLVVLNPFVTIAQSKEENEFKFQEEIFSQVNNFKLRDYLETDDGRESFAVLMTIELMNNKDLGFLDLYISDPFPGILVFTIADGLIGVVSYGFSDAKIMWTAFYNSMADGEIQANRAQLLMPLESYAEIGSTGEIFLMESGIIAQRVLELIQ